MKIVQDQKSALRTKYKVRQFREAMKAKRLRERMPGKIDIGVVK